MVSNLVFGYFTWMCCRLSNSVSGISCYSCESTIDAVSEQCLNQVGETRKYIKACPPNIDRCYARIKSHSEISRGCADDKAMHYRDCKRERSTPFCTICVGSLCNHWDTLQESELLCSFCSDQSYDTSCAEGATTRKCPVVTTHGRNIYCYTAFDLSTGVVQERGCMADELLIGSHGNFIWPCHGNNCNRKDDSGKFSCISFSGFVSKFDHQKQTVRCDKNRKSDVSGCYTIFKGKTAELGCNSQLPIQDFMALSRSDSAAQFCFESDCNGIIGGHKIIHILIGNNLQGC